MDDTAEEAVGYLNGCRDKKMFAGWIRNRSAVILAKTFMSGTGIKKKYIPQAAGGIGNLLDEKCRNKNLFALIKYTAGEDKGEKILEKQKFLKTPVVRNGKQATAGY